ncbi:MAG: cobalamin B12-binding domain-containing protein, partial [bacterium]|nr:cobalamin B12-binding domain-containing protein [bacterium]
MRIALINTNRIQPPIAPIGLDYVAEALDAAGHEVHMLDLCWEPSWQDAIPRFFSTADFDLIGVTLRNTDDCFAASQHNFLHEFQQMVVTLRKASHAPIIVGGAGFSVMP